MPQRDWNDADLLAMHRALAEAARGLGRVEPNPLVGAAIVRDGQIVAVGHHERFGGPHAEIVALKKAGEAARGATLFVTLEPCCHQGKTPPCTDALIAAGIVRVVAALRDPFPKVDGGGFERLRTRGITVETGLLADEARAQNWPYLKRTLTGRPFVIAKWAMTLDGKIATRRGDSRWISNPRSRALVHDLRRRVDAIVVGIGTALADNPELTARPPGPRAALRVVLDSGCRLPATGRLATSAREIPVLVVCGDRQDAQGASLQEAGCELLSFSGQARPSVGSLLDELGRRGCTNVLVEGGPGVLGSFFDAKEVDAVDIYIAPRLIGGSAAPSPIGGLGSARIDDAQILTALEIEQIGDDQRVRAQLAQPWRAEAARRTQS